MQNDPLPQAVIGIFLYEERPHCFALTYMFSSDFELRGQHPVTVPAGSDYGPPGEFFYFPDIQTVIISSASYETFCAVLMSAVSFPDLLCFS